ncbi:unnamed protein product, partial [Rotaria sp. Silwood1]
VIRNQVNHRRLVQQQRQQRRLQRRQQQQQQQQQQQLQQLQQLQQQAQQQYQVFFVAGSLRGGGSGFVLVTSDSPITVNMIPFSSSGSAGSAPTTRQQQWPDHPDYTQFDINNI